MHGRLRAPTLPAGAQCIGGMCYRVGSLLRARSRVMNRTRQCYEPGHVGSHHQPPPVDICRLCRVLHGVQHPARWLQPLLDAGTRLSSRRLPPGRAPARGRKVPTTGLPLQGAYRCPDCVLRNVSAAAAGTHAFNLVGALWEKQSSTA